MSCVGMPVPTGLFSSQDKAIASINAILGAYKAFGSNVTILELVKAGTLPEGFQVIGAISAAFYIGAAIGAAAYATGQWSADNLWSVAPSTGSLDKIIADAGKLGIDIPKQVAMHTQRSAGSLQASLKSETA